MLEGKKRTLFITLVRGEKDRERCPQPGPQGNFSLRAPSVPSVFGWAGDMPALLRFLYVPLRRWNPSAVSGNSVSVPFRSARSRRIDLPLAPAEQTPGSIGLGIRNRFVAEPHR